MDKLKKAISDNGNIKAPGSDGLPPIVYKKLGPKALHMLLKIYKASYLMSLHPDAWLDVKCIFIPKPGKESEDPTSYRPILLLSCIGKVAEKMV